MAAAVAPGTSKALPNVIALTQEFKRSNHKTPSKPLAGLDAFVNNLAGFYARRESVLADLRVNAEQIDSMASRWLDMRDHLLQEKLDEFRKQFRRYPNRRESPVNEALAAIREAAARHVGLRPFTVQMMGALALHRGYLAEMATGEGKTLTAGLAAVLAGWTALPCHIITANDYLVQRDAEWLRPLYRFCGLKTGYVTALMNPRDRRAAYSCDITYTTSKEIVADFLRDQLRLGQWQNPTRQLIQTLLNRDFADLKGLVMRGLHTAIVDEADCLLVDESVTPLIIAAPHKNETLREATRLAYETAASLAPEDDYTIDSRRREIEIIESGHQKILAQSGSMPGRFRGLNRRMELVRQAINAREFFHRGKQYVIEAGRVTIVDEFTGRLMPQRTWRAGLHQAIEAKEGLEITDPTETMARLSFQRFFRMYNKLAGMTGTAREASREFWQIFRLPVISIPTNKPCLRIEQEDRIFADADSKWQAIVSDIIELHKQGRPMLIGTRSVVASEQLAERLNAAGLKFHLLNAMRHRIEAQIIAEAGQPGQITIATNMAGRGTDIRLGPGVAQIGGLHVIATERHEARRIDRQLFGRTSRQGDPGSAQAYVSLDDELMHRYLPRAVRGRLQDALHKGVPGISKIASTSIAFAQKRAEFQAFRLRRAVLRMDTWLDESLSFAGPRSA